MNEAVSQVLNGFLKLNMQERNDFVNELNRYLSGNQFDQRHTEELMQKRSLGPKNSVCKCCGR